jgi:Fic family protein/molecular chaperone DnaK (HSP70)
MDAPPDIIPLTKSQIPSILSYDQNQGRYVIGLAARALGIKGQTNAFNFKPDLGLSPAKFEGKSPKDKTYWFRADDNTGRIATTLSPKDVIRAFLATLFAEFSERPDALIIGEPAIRDEIWRDYFRTHIREVFRELTLPAPIFFPEPFAVFQYYRHVVGAIPKVETPQTVLIIDFGGGTFDTCIIQTTQSGDLSRSGANAVPLGVQSIAKAGRDIDKGLLEVLVRRARSIGIRFKDDPIKRAQHAAIPVLFFVENAKLKLSEKLQGRIFKDDCSSVTEEISIPSGILHPEEEIRGNLTGDDLKQVIHTLWRRELGDIVVKCVREASQRLKTDIKVIDKVLLAGGSAQLPFVTEMVFTTLPTLVKRENIIVGKAAGEAVAYGIAIECREQSRRIPTLASGRIAPCVLNDLYLSFASTRRDRARPAVIKKPQRSKDGHLVVTPFECENLVAKYQLELPFSPKKQLFYWFTEQPVEDDAMKQRLNVTSDVISVPPQASNHLRLELHLLKNGEVTPHFEFLLANSKSRQEFRTVECKPFYFADLRIVEGRRYFGLDFGTSNSYVVEFLSPSTSVPVQTSYPELRVSTRLTERLRELELLIGARRGEGLLNWQFIRRYAEKVKLNFVFHSNKIEGNRLTQGETQEAFDLPSSARISEQQRAALNSQHAYDWMLESRASVFSDTEGFIRHLNSLLMHGLLDDAGKYRSGPVKISGTEFLPPSAVAVPDMMRQLATEIKNAGGDRSAVELAATAHTKFVWIHPFSDGNGRTARLLLNSILLARGLPHIVINFDDRERYMDALVAADGGDLSPFLELILECFDRALAEVKQPDSKEPEPETVTPSILDNEQKSPVNSALRAIQAAESGAAESVTDRNLQESRAANEDFLRSVMEEKLRADQAQYEAWTQAFESLAKQAEALTAEFNRNYLQSNFSASFRRYDMLTREKYDLLAVGKRAPRTWLFSLEVKSTNSWGRLIFFFQRASGDAHRTARMSPVSLAISRYDGEAYHRLAAEPIWLREIVYSQGTLLPVGRDDRNRNLKIAKALELTLAETIKAYL